MNSKPLLNVLEDCYIGELDADYLLELEKLFCSKFEIKPDKDSIVRNELGKPMKFFGVSLYNRITAEKSEPEISNLVFLRALVHENRKLTKSIVRNRLKPQDIEVLISHLKSKYQTLEELKDSMKKAGITDSFLQNYFVRLFKDLELLYKKDGIWILDIDEAKRLCGISETKRELNLQASETDEDDEVADTAG